MSRSNRKFDLHDDSTWKIVYMDMITVLMVMFLTLWLASNRATQEPKKGGDISENRIIIPADDFFDSGQDVLKASARARIREIFLERENHIPAPGRDGNDRLVYVIEGYTDDQGEKTSNFILGFKRALAVYNELNSSGKLANFSQNVSICSHADNQPWRPEVGEKIEKSVSPTASSFLLSKDLLRRRNRRVSLKLETESDYFSDADSKDEMEE